MAEQLHHVVLREMLEEINAGQGRLAVVRLLAQPFDGVLNAGCGADLSCKGNLFRAGVDSGHALKTAFIQPPEETAMAASQFGDRLLAIDREPWQDDTVPHVHAIPGRLPHVIQSADAPRGGLVLVIIEMAHASYTPLRSLRDCASARPNSSKRISGR